MLFDKLPHLEMTPIEPLGENTLNTLNCVKTAVRDEEIPHLIVAAQKATQLRPDNPVTILGTIGEDIEPMDGLTLIKIIFDGGPGKDLTEFWKLYEADKGSQSAQAQAGGLGKKALAFLSSVTSKTN